MRARSYLILMALAILVPAAAIMAAGLSMLLQWERESRMRAVQETGRNTALAIDRDVAAAEALLRGVVNAEALRDADFARLHREISAMNAATPWSWTVLIDYDGHPYFNTLVPLGTRLPGRAGPWVAKTWDTQATRVSGYFIGALSGRATVSVDVPVPRAVGKRYVVSQIFDARYFSHVFDNEALGRGWLITIFDANGISIARNRNAAALVGKAVKPELYRAAHARPAGMVRHLTRIVDDLLDVRRILSGKVELRKARLDAGALLRQCCETKMAVDAGAHAWSVAVPALWVEGDATRLEQVFDNLLHNAVKYTPAGGAIAVRARAEGNQAVIELADTGVGIAADTLPLIFDALVQGPTSIDRAQGGLGLGLALVKQLAALHGGRISAHSDGPGRGSTFTLVFPLAAEPAAEPAASPA
jgi:signal transduction histidine kinase